MDSAGVNRVAVSLLVFGSLLLSGCFHAGVRPRSADVLDAGQVSAGVNLTLATLEGAQVKTADGEEFSGFSGMRSMMHPLVAIYAAALDSQGYVRVGFADGAEAGVLFGYQELGAEVRAAVLDEDRGDGLSMAASAGATWRPFMDMKTPHFRAGVDLSSRFKRVIPIWGLYATFGPETHAVALPSDIKEECDGFGSPGCGEFGPQSHFLYTRREFRLQSTMGMSVRFADGHAGTWEPRRIRGHRLTFGVVPYASLWSDSTKFECVECRMAEGDFRSDFGMHITVAYDYFPEDELLDD
ncbi:hypothetical protein [Bradymonas sediminis]|uniref:Uncharacterized protein n=1 Tax=Bradymonas sediminis TaxID=1548548 RepID=A0A2Z4FP38_9DELT|nr:hypothetical protein [Bradymonas sediminis]AWV90424.1 hypothetical protein DN745_14235 [Bradymonas sediminis]TDP72190.1 hypothetical protein DFR33_107172 [Bradymonas sediminis]